MPRAPRFDEPGCLHHVMSRGLARRTIFETRADVRFFLSLLARARHRGELEIHAYSIMSTHFHLLVRSLNGHLSNTMRRILNRYVRYFNRSRRRDGPLMRGRFRSIPVRSVVYRRTLIRYIDQNAVQAGLVAAPQDYPYGSAQYTRLPGRRPLWLARGVVDDILATCAPREAMRAATYDAVFSPRLSDRHRDWIERRLNGKARGFDDLDDLLAGSESVAEWARRKAELADGTQPGVPLVDPATATDALHRAAGQLSGVDARPLSGRMRVAADLMRVAILRDCAGDAFVTIAQRLGVSHGTPQKLYRLHRECMAHADYSEAYGTLIRAALAMLHGDR